MVKVLSKLCLEKQVFDTKEINMAFGDIGGSYSQLIITCRSRDSIKKGDAVAFQEDYYVTNARGPLFGVALEDCVSPEIGFPVIVRGIVNVRKGTKISIQGHMILKTREGSWDILL